MGRACLIALTVSSGVAFAQAPSWDERIDAGRKAVANGQSADAIRLFTDALHTAEQSGREDLDVAHALLDLAMVYHKQQEETKAEPLIRHALAIQQKTLGPNNPEVIGSLTNLGGRLRDQGRFAEAEPLLVQAMEAGEKVFGPSSIEQVKALLGVASLYTKERKYAEAEPLLKRSITILEDLKAYGPAYPSLSEVLGRYADLLRKTNREAEAEKVEARATTRPSS